MSRREIVGMAGAATAVHSGPAPRGSFLHGQARSGGALTSPGIYPRLFFRREQALEIARRGRADGGAVGVEWRQFLTDADRLLEQPFYTFEYSLGSTNQHGRFFKPAHQMSRLGPILGFAYHATGDRRYAERLREALSYYGSFAQWYGPGMRQKSPPRQSELTTAAFLRGFATGYDALHDYLGAEERAKVRDATIVLGIVPMLDDWLLPVTRIHAIDTMGHNWWSVCVSSAGVAALALLEDEPRAAGWADDVKRAMEEWFDYRGGRQQNKPRSFDRRGAFYEGVHYTCYALGDYLRLLLAEANVRPTSAAVRPEWLPRIAEFIVHASYPTSSGLRTVNFGDSDLDDDCSDVMQLMELTGLGSAETAWYLRQVARGEKRQGDESSWHLTADTLINTFFRLLRSTRSTAGAGDFVLPRSIHYRDIGWGLMRSAWEDNATLLGVKCGDTWNHAHADAGSFVVFHAGQPLLIDSGTCFYDLPEYVDYYAASRAHNVVLFDGAGQPASDFARGPTRPGEVSSLLAGATLRYVRADAAGPMAHVFSRHQRHWIWVGRVIVMLDDVRAHWAGRFDWLLHYAGEAERLEEGARIVNGPAGATVKMIEPREWQLVEERGFVERKPTVEKTYLRFSTKAPAVDAKFVTAIVLSGEGEEPVIERLNAPDALGVRIVDGGIVTEVWFNLLADGRRMNENSLNRLGGWETDAAVLAFSGPQLDRSSGEAVPAHCLWAHGSTLRKDGLVAWDSLAKVDAIADRDTSVDLRVESTSPGLGHLYVGATAPAVFRLNGKSATFTHDAATGRASVALGISSLPEDRR